MLIPPRLPDMAAVLDAADEPIFPPVA